MAWVLLFPRVRGLTHVSLAILPSADNFVGAGRSQPPEAQASTVSLRLESWPGLRCLKSRKKKRKPSDYKAQMRSLEEDKGVKSKKSAQSA